MSFLYWQTYNKTNAFYNQNAEILQVFTTNSRMLDYVDRGSLCMQDYECMIASLQEQVERQSMMSSMTSSMMPDDFYDEEDETSGMCLLCAFMDTSVARQVPSFYISLH